MEQIEQKASWTLKDVQEAAGPKVNVSSVTVTISEVERKKEILRMEMDRILFWE
jgi:hypothetical protein